jgi:uncharacterized membrane-anchored protein YitT (DUF2179 family)
MNPFLQQLIIQTVRDKKSRKGSGRDKKPATAKEYSEFKIVVRREAISAFLMGLGVLSAGFGLKSFLLPTEFIDGGITGLSMLVSNITGTSLAILIPLLNIPFIVLGYTQIGLNFVIKTIIAISVLAFCLVSINYPVITSDKLLVALFGGFFLGAGIGLAIRGGAVLDGTEILAIYISRKFGLTAGDVIIMINVVIFSAAAYFLSIDTAFYSMLTYLAASKTLDFVIEGIEEYTGVTVISAHSNEIRKMVIEKLGRGVTIYKGSRGFGSHGEVGDIDIIYTVITRLEVNKLNTEIEKIDKNAFIVMNSIKDTRGGMIKKRPLS